jgi:hypothetical protein
MRRVFILGAGFSAGAGLPLASALTSRIIGRAGFREDDKRQLEELHASMGERATPEELADAVRQHACYLRMRALEFDRPPRTCVLMPEELESAESPEERAANVEIEREQLLADARWWEMEVPRALELGVMEQVVSGVVPPYVLEFVRSLSDQDSILSFNYDVLVEGAFEEAGLTFFNGFTGSRSQRPLLKLHGSIDWCIHRFDGQDRDEWETLHVESDQEEPGRQWRLVRFRDRRDLSRVVNLVRGGMGIGDAGGNFFRPAFPGLGTFKSIEDVPGLPHVWERASEALCHADELYVVGYSLSATDLFVRVAFGDVFAGRADNPLRRLVVIDPDKDKNLDLDAFQSVFRTRPDPHREPAEDVDWQGLLVGE